MRKYMLLLALLFTANVTWGQEVEQKAEFNGEASPAVSALKLASDLIKYGYAQQSALSLIDALQIMSENPTQPLKAAREGESVDVAKRDGKSEAISLDFNEILADAKELADGDESILSLISRIEADSKASHRGAVNGPSRTVESVNGNSTDTYQISFVKGYLAEVFVSGDGDTDLDLYIYDSNNNLIGKDADYTDDCYVSWVPAWTGRFTIKIVNRGPVYNRYVMLTN